MHKVVQMYVFVSVIVQVEIEFRFQGIYDGPRLVMICGWGVVFCDYFANGEL